MLNNNQTATSIAAANTSTTTFTTAVTSIAPTKTFWVWNQATNIPSNNFLFGGINDAFSASFKITASKNFTFEILDNVQYARFYNNENFTHVFKYTGNNLLLSNFNLSTGCAGYSDIIFPAGNYSVTLYPNETVTYAPANAPTGICAYN